MVDGGNDGKRWLEQRIHRNIGQYAIASCTVFCCGRSEVTTSRLVEALEARFAEDSQTKTLFRNKEMIHCEACTLSCPIRPLDRTTEKAADILATAVSQNTDVLSWLAASFSKEISSGCLSSVRDTLVCQLAKPLPSYFEDYVLPGILDAMEKSESAICHTALKTVDFANEKALRHYDEAFLQKNTANSFEHACENLEWGSIANFLHKEVQLADVSKNGLSDPVALIESNLLFPLLPNDRTLCSELFAKELALAAIDSLSENNEENSLDVRGSALA